MAKKWKPEDQIVAEILTEFMFCKSMEEVQKVWKDIFERYGLCEDPFTHMPCDIQQYCINSVEYEKQLMIEKYGHCDGLE